MIAPWFDGLKLASFWPIWGPILDSFWPDFGPNLARFWPDFGLFLMDFDGFWGFLVDLDAFLVDLDAFLDGNG